MKFISALIFSAFSLAAMADTTDFYKGQGVRSYSQPSQSACEVLSYTYSDRKIGFRVNFPKGGSIESYSYVLNLKSGKATSSSSQEVGTYKDTGSQIFIYFSNGTAVANYVGSTINYFEVLLKNGNYSQCKNLEYLSTESGIQIH